MPAEQKRTEVDVVIFVVFWSVLSDVNVGRASWNTSHWTVTYDTIDEE